MKKLINIIILFTSLCSFSQRTYHFDYAIDYSLTHYLDSTKNIGKTFFTNSRDNSYLAEVIKIDSLHSTVMFLDHKALAFKIVLNQQDLNYSKQNLNCQNIGRYHNPYKYQTDNYHFKTLNDTLIGGIRCKQIVLQSNSKLRAKGKKLGKLVYIFSPIIYHQPILFFSTAYEEWKINKVLPQGLLVESHFYNYKGELEFSEKVVNIKKTSRDFVIPKNCAY